MEEVDNLASERSMAQFDVEAMKVVWAGSQHALEVSDRISRLVASDPAFRKDNRTMLGRKELFKNTLRKAVHAWKRISELRLSEEEAKCLRSFVDEPAFTDLHWAADDAAMYSASDDDNITVACFFESHHIVPEPRLKTNPLVLL